MTATVRTRRPLRAVGLVVGGLLLVAVAVGAPSQGRGDPLAPDATGALGARALVLLLEEFGADVDLVRGPPPDDADVAVVLQDLLTDDDVGVTLNWVARGGVLLVGDQRSSLSDGTFDATCPALADVAELEVDRTGTTVERDNGAQACFDGFVRQRFPGDGSIFALGSPLPFTNELLDEADNAVLAAALLLPRGATKVAFVIGPSVEDEGDTTLGDLLGRNVAQGLVLASLAAVVWAASRGRRLGRPVAEGQPVAVAGSELVVAVGRLLDARRRPSESAEVLRTDARRALSARLGLAADADPRTLAATVASRSPLDVDRVAAALGERAVVSDDDLLAVAADLDRIRTDVLGSRPP